MLTEKRKSDLCLRCLECCKVLLFRVQADKLTVEFYETRGFKIYRPAPGLHFVEVPYECQHLTGFGCKIYPERPEVCRIYDGRKHPVMKTKCLWAKEK